jgi:hypothetical protein
VRSRTARCASRAASATGVAAALWCGVASAMPAPAGAVPAARVEGTFTMHARVTTAHNVRGERRGERLTRTWMIVPSRCHRNVCGTLRLNRTRGHGISSRLTLRRRSNGSYKGEGHFYVALSCRGHTYRRGSRARYTIGLRVTATRMIGGVRFARRVTATYDNPSRTDSTPCPLGPSHDAARYTGRLRAGAPSPPVVSFSVELNAMHVAAFEDTTNPGSGKGGRVSRKWSFGDPASGTLNGARGEDPTHEFSALGDYRVKLTETDAAGLRASADRIIVIRNSAAADKVGAG